MEVIEYIRAGGPVMIPIFGASILTLATALERLWALRRSRVIPSVFVAELLELARQARWGDGLTCCRKWESAASRVARVVLENRGQSRGLLKEKAEEVGRREVGELERNVWILATLASVSTLLGLLGTVGGMILTFRVVGTGQGAQVQDMAIGISQALVTTFSGLLVAIPAVVVHRFVLGRVDSLAGELEEFALLVVDAVAPAPSVP